jgi:hypothetical protein
MSQAVCESKMNAKIEIRVFKAGKWLDIMQKS